LIIFILSTSPFNLPLFGLRHLLPSTAILLLLCCYGLERLSQASARWAPLVAAGGAALLLTLGTVPMIKVLQAGSTRYPYDMVEQQVEASERSGTQAFTTSFYMEGEAVNFYCKSTCVQPLPQDESALPPRLLLLYRSRVTEEEKSYRQLIQSGYADVGHVLYTNGQGGSWGTTAASLERRK